MRKWFNQSGWFLFVFALLLPAGCTGKLGKMVPVSGKVSVGGKPVASGQVVYVPEKNLGGAIISGKIDNGTYTLTTDGKDGAPLGRYKVFLTTSTPGAKESGASINAKYSSPNTSGLTREVVEAPAPNAYDLTLPR